MEILQFSMISCGIFYLIICIFSVLRFFRVYKHKSKVTNISLFLYLSMIIAALARGTSLYLISFNLGEQKDKNDDLELFVYLMIICPDMLNICVYIILLWYYLASFIMAHINLANDLKLFLKDDNPTMKLKTYIILYIILFGYLITFIILGVLTFLNFISQSNLYLIDSIFNVASPFIFIGYYFYIICKYSGRPYITEKLKTQVHRIFLIVIVWSITRILVGIFGLVYSNVLKAIKDEFAKISKNFTFSILIIVYFFITEFLPDYFALDYQFMMFNIGENEDNGDHEDDQIERQRTSSLLYQNLNLNSSEITASQNNDRHNQTLKTTISRKTIQNIKKKDDILLHKNIILVKDELVGYRRHGLGKIYKGKVNDYDSSIRVIDFQRLSRYDLEGLSNDIDEILNLDHANICKIIGVCVEDIPKIYIATPFFKKGTLYDILHSNDKKLQLDFDARINLAKKIALGINYLHSKNIVHGHLSSKNIFINDNLEPLICDYGFLNIKKIANVFLKYKNKNSYSSPEILKEPIDITNSIKTLDFTSDSYSFGILLWEIYTGTYPFNVNISTLFNLVVENDFRPEIKDNFHLGVAHLIQLCWDTNKEKRPNFNEIIHLLNKIY